MPDENTFFLPVGENCHRGLITCRVNDRVFKAALIMREKSISSLVVCDAQDLPVGIMTDRDLRNKVVAAAADAKELRVEEIMTTPVLSVKENDSLFEVLYQMSRHRIHRLGVVDVNNRLIGMINESDIIRLHNRSPQRLLRAIDEACDIATLKKVYEDTDQLVVFLNRTGIRTRDLIRLIALFNDQIASRLISLLKQQRFPDLPEGFGFLVLGSEGRREQTLTTDQDNAIIYSDALNEAEIERIREFAQELIAALIEIGVPECPGGIMAKNDFWFRSYSNWEQALQGWVRVPNGENILNFSMFSDMRTLWGDARLEEKLRAQITQSAQEDVLFLAHMAANVCRFTPPLGFLGGLKTEKQGEHDGEIDLKKAGIFALTEGIKILALEQGILGVGTRDKLQQLGQREVLDSQQVKDLEAAFTLLCFFRLRGQVEAVAVGNEPDNFIMPSSLDRVEKGRLKVALQVVQSFQSTLKAHFRLGMMTS